MPKVYLGAGPRESARFTDWVLGRLKDSSMSQADLARELSVSQQAVSRKIKAKSWSLADMAAICDTFGTDYTISAR